jgi:hypothetical protein
MTSESLFAILEEILVKSSERAEITTFKFLVIHRWYVNRLLKKLLRVNFI